MLYGSSESQLKDLEHSNDGLDGLLDRANSIAETRYNKLTRQYERLNTTSTKSQTFKEQWLLRWVVKRLGDGVQRISDSKAQPSARSFATNKKTWAFLVYLLVTIPFQQSVDIFLERNFAKLLIKAGPLLTENDESRSLYSHDPVPEINNSQRPPKRRRLSPPTEFSPEQAESNTVETRQAALYQYLKVIELWGDALLSGQQTSSGSSRVVIPAWAETLREAAELIGVITAAVEHLLRTSNEDVVISTSSNSTIRWLRLWHMFAASSSMTNKKLAHKAFNEACLERCLTLYDFLVAKKAPYVTNLIKEIEKSIALYTVSAMRSAVNSKLSAAWRADKDIISWVDIEPICNVIQDQLGNALRTESIANHEIRSLPKSSWASHLISMASRLVPKADVRNRLRELPWLQAFVVSLGYLAFPREMPKLYKDSNGLLQQAADILPPDTNAIMHWPGEYLTTIQQEEIALTMPIKEYLVASICSWRYQPLPLTVLFTLVQMDSGLFVPEAERPNSGLRLNDILTIVNERKAVNETDYDRVIEYIILPIMESAIKARDFEGLLNFWLPALSEALRVRATAVFTVDDIPVGLMWDDEDLLTRFTNLCHLHGSIAFDRKLFSDVIDELKTIREKIGPTSDIFAKLAICNCVLEAGGPNLLRHSDVAKSLGMLADSIAEAIQGQNDYQGQRWRLWSAIAALRRVDAQFDRYNLVAKALEIACTRFYKMSSKAVAELQQGRRSSLLMEQREMFALLIEQSVQAVETEDYPESLTHKLLTIKIENLVKSLQELPNAHKTKPKSHIEVGSDSVWNGKINNLRSKEQLVQCDLAIMLSNPDFLNNKDKRILDLLSMVTETLGDEKASSGQTSVGNTFIDRVTSFLARSGSGFLVNGGAPKDVLNGDIVAANISPSEPWELTGPFVDSLAKTVFDSIELDNTTCYKKLQGFLGEKKQDLDLRAVLESAVIVSDVDKSTLQHDESLARMMASSITLGLSDIVLKPPQLLLFLEYCTFVLSLRPRIVNQATVDALLKDAATITSAAPKVDMNNLMGIENDAAHVEIAIFDRVVALVGVLLARYRGRLTGRTHLLLPVLQHLLKCFFYSPNRSYLYQNAAMSKQKSEFRATLPHWLGAATLPVSSATKFTKVVTSICNPSTASARSAHRNRRKDESAPMELNDGVNKAKRIAAQSMQYLIMEYARCSLDGVISPEVRESLMPGIYTILDAMDRDLMRAMNAAMDPSSRAIFKGLYDDWVKYWKWDQS